MARYDLMHWSQRVRDEQAAQRQAAPPPLSMPDEPSSAPRKPRRQRPKPTPNPDADHVLQLCREGRLFELQQWIAAGRSIVMPSDYRKSPLGIAVQTGFHSLIELLLQHESDQAAKNAMLIEACQDAKSVWWNWRCSTAPIHALPRSKPHNFAHYAARYNGNG